uniref:choline-phosphate cytidylyltransferase n=1 Tax=Albugo laibachii Nc14 TaxID=890382 RepID=F0WYF1_9STRA|nr:cholinephosphate cytidylyltransferase B putative [Albugo laibachii Nc14]CCA27395.1 cholinephosphate cytidylyltransferase B putative [Albugo laibachii Nc14]|eukprot:CCA27395.1 cholinephosphate cytidylyltransferase B putative [Albugo laibachii Nc14]
MAKKRKSREYSEEEESSSLERTRDYYSDEERDSSKTKTTRVSYSSSEEWSDTSAPSQMNRHDEIYSRSRSPSVEPFRKVLVDGEPGTLTGRPLRLYADGIFDLFHFGHAKALQQCKQAYPHVFLLVGCNSDEMTHQLKGKTVMTDKERYESLRHCKWVDEVIEDAPWVITDEFLDKHAIDYVCHDSLPYSDTSGESSDGDVYDRIKKMGKFLETKRTDGISTSDLINRIIKEYDTFIRRNLQRGYTGKEMNVSYLKEQSIKFDMAVDKVKHDVDGFIHKWVGKADELQYNFLDLFSRDGPLRTSLRKRRRILKERLTDIAREKLR